MICTCDVLVASAKGEPGVVGGMASDTWVAFTTAEFAIPDLQASARKFLVRL